MLNSRPTETHFPSTVSEMEIVVLIRSKSVSPGQCLPDAARDGKKKAPEFQTQSCVVRSSQPLAWPLRMPHRPQITSQLSSAAWQNLLHATLADRLKLLMDIFSSTISSAKVSAPLAMAPTNTQQLSCGFNVSM